MRSVNLTPLRCQQAWDRRKRLHVWVATNVAAALLVAAVALHLLNSEKETDELRTELHRLAAQQLNLERRYVAAQRERDELLHSARLLAAMRPPPILPLRLAALCSATPEKVAFTRVVARPPSPAPEPAPASAAKPDARAAARPAAPAAPARPTLEIAGYAEDHEHLAQLIAALQQIPEWREVALRRATRTSLGRGAALSFEMDCFSAGGAP